MTEPFETTDEQRDELVELVAREIQLRGLTGPAVSFLEASRPYRPLGANAMLFFDPLLRGFGTVVSDHDDYAALRVAPFAPQDRGEPASDKLGLIPEAPARISGPCFVESPKRLSQATGPICPHPAPAR